MSYIRRLFRRDRTCGLGHIANDRLAEASSVSLPTVKRLEAKPGPLVAHASTLVALSRALEVAGVEFIDENGGGAGVRLRNHQRPKQPK
jgi:hypothetical protein